MSKALVILSGGQDSTTCAAIARRDHDEVHAITFDYGQRHDIELHAANAVAKALKLTTHEILSVGDNILQGNSPLVKSGGVVEKYDPKGELPGGIEKTFVEGRNILFLTIAANRASIRGCSHIFIGVSSEDSGGYPDCEKPFINKMSAALLSGIYGESAPTGEKSPLQIHTPLMNLSKAESVLAAREVMGEQFESIMRETHTCYDNVRGGCGRCHACILRDRGFSAAGVDDPLWLLR